MKKLTKEEGLKVIENFLSRESRRLKRELGLYYALYTACLPENPFSGDWKKEARKNWARRVKYLTPRQLNQLTAEILETALSRLYITKQVSVVRFRMAQRKALTEREANIILVVYISPGSDMPKDRAIE